MGSQFPDQGSNQRPLQWKRGVLTTGPPGKSHDLAFKAGFVNLGPTDIPGQMSCPPVFILEACPVRCRGFCSIPYLYPLDASSTHLPGVTTKTVSRQCQMSPWRGLGGAGGRAWGAVSSPIENQFSKHHF